MAEPEHLERPQLQALDRVRAELEAVDAAATEAERAVQEELQRAESAEDFQRLRRSLVGVVATADALTDRFRALARSVDAGEEEWNASNRYTEQGLEALASTLQTAFRRPSDVARRWLNEILDAIRASELDAAVRIAELPVELSDELASGRDRIRTLVRGVRDGDAAAGLALTQPLAAGELDGWHRVLDSSLRARAHRLAALHAMRAADQELARSHVDAAVETDSQNGLNYAERAAYWLFVGDFERAAADAQQAVDLAPDDPAGHLMLGLWSELTGELEEAEELYNRGLERMTTHAVSTLTRRASLIDPSGLQLAVAGERLLEARRRQPALDAAAGALAAGVRGREAHADARVYRLRSHALELPPEDREGAAAAAVEAGKRYSWNDDGRTAAAELRRAIELDFHVAEARWLLADALVSTSFPDGAALADRDVLDEARAIWDQSAEMFGLPAGAESWAYLTRAIIADLTSMHDDQDRQQGQWQAVIDCERALVHNDADGVRWGFAARYLRALGLQEAAFEAVERGYELSGSANVVLDERLALLANKGRFEEASSLARDLVASYGEQPWVAGVRAWLALHQGDYEEAITLVDLPLSRGYDLSWYFDLRALCHIALGDVDAGRRDFAAILAGLADGSIRVTDGSVQVNAAFASAIAGDLAEAHRWFEEARDDVTARDDTSYPAVCAFLALAADDLERARAELRTAVAVTRTHRDLDDLFALLRLRLRALPDDGAKLALRESVLRDIEDELAKERHEAIDAEEPTPETELAKVLAEAADEDELARVAVLAIEGRRLRARDLGAAAERYELLRSSLFEPEATFALVRTLGELSDAAVARGDVEETRSAQRRLVELGRSDAVDAALAVSAALRAAGDVRGAHGELAAVVDLADDGAKHDLLRQALGDLELAGGDAASAERHFDLALALARERNDLSRVAQLETRAALAELVGGGRVTASQRVLRAIHAWREAGAFDPLWTIVQEARGLLTGAADSEPTRRAVDSLLELVESSDIRAAAGVAPAEAGEIDPEQNV